MRKALRELIDPYVNKQTVDREQVNETKRLLVNVSKRVHDLEAILFKNSEAHTVFDDINRRIGELVMERIMKAFIGREDQCSVDQGGRREAAG